MDDVTNSDGSLQKEFLLSDHKIHEFSFFFVPNNNMRLIGHKTGLDNCLFKGKKNKYLDKKRKKKQILSLLLIITMDIQNYKIIFLYYLSS